MQSHLCTSFFFSFSFFKHFSVFLLHVWITSLNTSPHDWPWHLRILKHFCPARGWSALATQLSIVRSNHCSPPDPARSSESSLWLLSILLTPGNPSKTTTTFWDLSSMFPLLSQAHCVPNPSTFATVSAFTLQSASWFTSQSRGREYLSPAEVLWSFH